MGHPGSHPAQGGNFFGLHQLLLGLFQLPSHPFTLAQGLQFSLHAFLLTQVRKDADAADLSASFHYSCGGKTHRYFLRIFAGKGDARRIQFSCMTIVAAAHPPHHLVGNIVIVEPAQSVRFPNNLLGGETQDTFGSLVENQNIPLGVHHHNTVHRTLDEVVKETVGLAEFTFDSNSFGKIAEVQVGDSACTHTGYRHAGLEVLVYILPIKI